MPEPVAVVRTVELTVDRFLSFIIGGPKVFNVLVGVPEQARLLDIRRKNVPAPTPGGLARNEMLEFTFAAEQWPDKKTEGRFPILIGPLVQLELPYSPTIQMLPAGESVREHEDEPPRTA